MTMGEVRRMSRRWPAILVAGLVACGGTGGGGDVLPGGAYEALEVGAETGGSDAIETNAVDALPELCTVSCPAAPLEVATAGGVVRGVAIDVPVDAGATTAPVRVYKGIPYAAPPVGDLRFRSPRPALVRADVLDATAFGPACMQGANPMSDATSYSEDCLTLNVWAPGVDRRRPSPVVVFVHGGGYIMGSATSATLDGSHWAAAYGVITVTFNYRLGPFGFLAHPALTAEDPAHPASGNWGLEDQRAALLWVRDNIAAFGGDPANVTLAGQSAGGMSVALQAVSPPAKGLFRRVVVESAFAYENLATLAQAEAQGQQLAEALGCAGDDTLTCLRAAPAKDVLDALTLKNGIFFGEGAAWNPWVDGLTVPDQPHARIVAGAASDLEVILGSNGDEGSLLRFLAFTAGVKPADYEPFVRGVFLDLADTVLARYPLEAYASPNAAMDALLGHFVFVCPSRRTARAFRDAGSPVLLYRFLHAPGFLPLPGAASYHTAELPFVFDAPPKGRTFTADQAALAAAMSGAWAAFAAGGPAAVGSLDAARDGSTWAPMPAGSDAHAVWDVGALPGQGVDYEAEACDFWDTLAARP